MIHSDSAEHQIGNTTILLLPQKCAFLPQHKALLVADLHVGKAMHFRRNGIAIPPEIEQQNLVLLDEIIQTTEAVEVIFLGDLFHSKANQATESFSQWMLNKQNIQFTLIVGNHDRYVLNANTLMIPSTPSMTIGDLWLTHEPDENTPDLLYNLAGHIHPVYSIKAKGFSSVRLPCFHFSKKGAILPAFGQFTGGFNVNPSKNDKVYVIADGQVISIENL